MQQVRRVNEERRELLRGLLTDPKISPLFQTFCKNTYCNELADFWHGVEDYKKLSQGERPKRAQELYENFLAPNAPEQINIPLTQTQQTIPAEELQLGALELFDSSQLMAFEAMERDVLFRFMRSEFMETCQRILKGEEPENTESEDDGSEGPASLSKSPSKRSFFSCWGGYRT